MTGNCGVVIRCVRGARRKSGSKLPGNLASLLAWTVIIGMNLTMLSAGLDCPDNTHPLNDQRCCPMCPPGSGVESPCNTNNDTRCQECTPGMTFSNEYSHIEVCRPCRACPPDSHGVLLCNGTHDTLCECDQGYYWDYLEKRCRVCLPCAPGFGVVRQCNNHQNTRCRPCPPRTFSDRRSRAVCRVCSVCGPRQVMLQSCTSKQNTVCVDIPPAQSPQPHAPHEHHSSGKQDSQNQTNIIPVYCSLLGGVILSLLIYVIIRHCRRNKPRKTPPGGTAANDPLVGAANKESDSGVYVDAETRTVLSGCHVRDLPEPKRAYLEQQLHSRDHGGWRALAHELGYNNSRIASFEHRARTDCASPVTYLLRDWSKSNSATIDALVRALHSVGRHELARGLVADHKQNSHTLQQPKTNHLRQIII